MSDEKTTGSLAELKRLLHDFDTAMLVTADRDGRLHARPMALQNDEELKDCDLWFVTADPSHKTVDIEAHHQVNVCCLRTRDKAYISISALARVENNPALVKKLWKPDWKIWFGEKPADGTIAILKLSVQHAEYWQPEGGRLRVLYSLLKGMVTDETAEENLNPPKRIG